MEDRHQYPIKRVDDFDPRRCQAVIPSRGQCNLMAVEGSQYRPCHGGNKAAQDQKKARIHRYRVAKYQARVDSLTDNNAIKSLRDEIALIRMLVQNHLNFVEQDDNHLLTFSSVIQKLIRQVESLSISCAQIENKLKDFMDAGNAIEMAHDLIGAVRTKVPDSEISSAVRHEVTEAISHLHSEQHGGTTQNYELKAWVEEIAQFATTERIISIRNEIGVLRLIVEERLNRCRTPHDLLCAAMPISNAIADIEKLVKSCQRLEDATGILLNEEAAVMFADQLIVIVGNHIQDSELLQEIVHEFTSSIST